MSGVVTPGSAQWPSLAWSLPSTCDTSDATMNLECVEKTITMSRNGFHNKEIQIAMPYLTLSADLDYQLVAQLPCCRRNLGPLPSQNFRGPEEEATDPSRRGPEKEAAYLDQNCHPPLEEKVIYPR